MRVALAALGVLLEAALEQQPQPRRRPARQQRPVRLALQHGGLHVRHGRARERGAAGEHLVEHAAERPQVGAAVDAPPASLLGAHVAGRAQHSAGDRHAPAQRGRLGRVRLARGLEHGREPEVEHAHAAVGRDLDVRGLQVAVHDALVVRRRERARDLARHAQRLGLRQRPARDPLGERLALDELHHQVVDRRAVPARGLSDLVNDRDPRVAERGEQPRLALEARQPVAGVRDLLGQDLDRHLAPQAGVERPVHLAHAPAPERAPDLVRPELLPDLEAHRVKVSSIKSFLCARAVSGRELKQLPEGPTTMPARRSTLA